MELSIDSFFRRRWRVNQLVSLNIHFILKFFILLLPISPLAAYDMDGNFLFANLVPEIEFKIDESGILTIEDLKRQLDWKKSVSPVLTLKVVKKAIWIRLRLTNSTDEDISWFLKYGYQLTNRIDCYIDFEKPIVTGLDYSYLTRPIRSSSFVFPGKTKRKSDSLAILWIYNCFARL